MSRLLEYDKLQNVRDLGGMRTGDGRRIREGCLVRCGHMADLTEADMQRLSQLADTVVDFRTGSERQRQPDRQVDGIHYVALPVVDSLKPGITREQESDETVIARMALDPEGAEQYMCEMYRSFATDGYAVSQYGKFVRILLEEHRKAVVWHCTAGKDRAGMASVIVEEILGIPREEIIEDYMRTNEYLKESIEFLVSFVQSGMHIDSPLAGEALRHLFGAERAFIDAYYGQIETCFGSFETFVREGLRLSREDEEKLRGRYLEKL